MSTTPVTESWWLMESTVTPRPLYYAGHNKRSDGSLKPTMTEDAARAVRFPDEWTAKYTLAHLLGIDVSGSAWPLDFMNCGYAVREHIFDYTPAVGVALTPSPEPCPLGQDRHDKDCTNRHQCWEQCGELGKDERFVRVGRTDPRKVNDADGVREDGNAAP